MEAEEDLIGSKEKKKADREGEKSNKQGRKKRGERDNHKSQWTD